MPAIVDPAGHRGAIMRSQTCGTSRWVEPLDAALLQEFVEVATQLSPEWLASDGECSAAQIQRRARRLHAQWHTLERKAGREVTEAEVWAWEDARWARGGAR